MRVISQDGTMDFPYDSSSVFIYGGCINGRIYVRMQLCGGYDDSVDVADYSAKAKAIKAMEMLRASYKRNLAMGLMSEKARRVFANAESGMSNVEIMVDISEELTEFEWFQFPQDDEIEV